MASAANGVEASPVTTNAYLPGMSLSDIDIIVIIFVAFCSL
jgi:hypothetical protein